MLSWSIKIYLQIFLTSQWGGGEREYHFQIAPCMYVPEGYKDSSYGFLTTSSNVEQIRIFHITSSETDKTFSQIVYSGRRLLDSKYIVTYRKKFVY